MSFFTGGKSFMSNGYVIWRNGLAGEPPNLYGVRQGSTYADRMFYIRSLDVRSSFYKFTQYLLAIADKEAIKEKQYIDLKLSKMRDSIIDKESINAIQKAIDANNFGLAYTLLTQRDLKIQELKRELASSHFNNISHMNSFWKEQFVEYVGQVLEDQVEIRHHQLMAKLTADSSITIENLVDNWFDKMLIGSDGVILESLNPIRSQMKEELLLYFQKAGIEGVNSITSSIFGTKGNITTLRKFKTTRKKRGGDKSIKGLINEIKTSMGNAVGRGISAELSVTARQGAHGAVSFNTGSLTKQIKNEFTGKFSEVKQTTDVTSFEIFSGSYDIQSTANSIFDNQFTPLNEKIDAFRKELEQEARNNTSDIFEVSTNVKGYRSKRDLQIKGEASFGARMSALKQMSNEVQGMPPLSMEKLIFMLNNTVDGCIADGEKEELAGYIAAVCVAWMWDDYTDLFSLTESSSIKKIRLFNSGGMYYSASQIIKRTVSDLINLASGSSFVNVEINPPQFNADGMYLQLRDQYPAHGNTPQEWQNSLAPRWNAMRDYVQSHGTISIKFQQAGLESIIGKLSQFL